MCCYQLLSLSDLFLFFCGTLWNSFTFLKNTLLHMISEKHQSHSKRKPSPILEIFIPLKVVSFAIFFLDLVK